MSKTKAWSHFKSGHHVPVVNSESNHFISCAICPSDAILAKSVTLNPFPEWCWQCLPPSTMTYYALCKLFCLEYNQSHWWIVFGCEGQELASDWSRLIGTSAKVVFALHCIGKRVGDGGARGRGWEGVKQKLKLTGRTLATHYSSC